MRCIIVEDQPPAQRILQKFMEDVGNLQLVGVFSDGIRAMEFLNSETVDLMFLDIHLPKITGIDFLKSLQNPPHVILTTAFSDYALEGYDLNVVDYLLKPFSFQRFLQAVNKVPKRHENRSQQIPENQTTPDLMEIFIKSGHDLLKVTIDEIFSITSDSDYTEIQLESRKILSSDSLRHWLGELENKGFIQVHKSYIVNPSKIERISGNLVYMKNETKLPIGRAYKEQFMKRLMP